MINYNPLRYREKLLTLEETKKFICLGVVVENNWRCISRAVTQILPEISAKNIVKEKTKSFKIGFKVPGPGTFAVIFKPQGVRITLFS